MASKIYGPDTMRFLMNFIESFWHQNVIAYLDIVFGNYIQIEKVTSGVLHGKNDTWIITVPGRHFTGMAFEFLLEWCVLNRNFYFLI